jgi:hypothetical protein
MTAASRSRKRKRQPRKPVEGKLPLSVTNKEGKTTVRQYVDRRFVRFGEVRGKVVAHVELFTSKQDSHSLTIRFQDQTALQLSIAPGFTMNAEYYKSEGLGDPKVLKRWPEIRSEQLT